MVAVVTCHFLSPITELRRFKIMPIRDPGNGCVEFLCQQHMVCWPSLKQANVLTETNPTRSPMALCSLPPSSTQSLSMSYLRKGYTLEQDTGASYSNQSVKRSVCCTRSPADTSLRAVLLPGAVMISSAILVGTCPKESFTLPS